MKIEHVNCRENATQPVPSYVEPFRVLPIFDAYAAGCTKSTLNFVVDEDEKRDATYTALSRSVLTVLMWEELSAHEPMRLFMRQNTVGAETSARCSSNRRNRHTPPQLEYVVVDLMLILLVHCHNVIFEM